MRILSVVHNFLPAHRAGSETYAFHLASAVRKLTGAEQRVFTTDTRPDLPPYSRREYDCDGLAVVEINQPQDHVRFSDSFIDRRIESLFDAELRRFMPDAVHFHHWLHLSAGLAARVPAHVPRIMHLHDFWLTCARGGQRLDESGRICGSVDLDKCASCISGMYLDISAGGRIAERIESFSGDSAGALRPGGSRLRSLVRKLGPLVPAVAGLPPKYLPREVRRDLGLREQMLKAACAEIDLFIAPSVFLRDRMIEWGIPDSRIRHSDYGFLPPVRILKPEPGGVFTAGFCGTLAPHKGVHVLIRAFRLLQKESRRPVALRIYGNRSHFPSYVRLLDRLSEGLPVEWAGAFDDGTRDEAYGSMDALAVPSLWWENSPLTIHEAFQRGVPVVVSDLGGMSELVRDGAGGLRFPAGDATALKDRLLRLASDENARRGVAASAPPVKTIEEDARWMSGLLETLAARRRAH